MLVLFGGIMSKVIFWDFDGTVVYSTPLWSSSVFNALKEVEPETHIELEDIRKYMAFGFTWHTPDEDYSSLKGEKWWEFMNKHIYESYINLGVDGETAQRATAKVRNIIKEKRNYILYDDFEYTVTELRKRGFTNVILSNNYPELKEVMDKLQITEYFDGIIVSALEGYDKPRKELFEIAKSRYQADEYYMIGDSVNADIIGGNNAGMKTILVHNGYSENADYCIDNIKSVLTILNKAE